MQLCLSHSLYVQAMVSSSIGFSPSCITDLLSIGFRIFVFANCIRVEKEVEGKHGGREFLEVASHE